MPMHNWKRVSPGIYHDFHHDWISTIRAHLNAGVLPSGFFAMAEQIVGGPAPDVVALKNRARAIEDAIVNKGVGIAVAEPMAPPTTTFVLENTDERYVTKKSQVVVRHELGEVVAVIELVSPGNKSSRFELQRLVEKSIELLRAGIHVLIVDPFPPSLRDPNGLPPLIWQDLCGEAEFELPSNQQLTVSSYQAHPAREWKAYIETFDIGQPLPTMPLFLTDKNYIQLALETTYLETWSKLPHQVQSLLTSPAG